MLRTYFYNFIILWPQTADNTATTDKKPTADPSLLSPSVGVIGRTEGFPRMGYFLPVCDGVGVWPNYIVVLDAAYSGGRAP